MTQSKGSGPAGGDGRQCVAFVTLGQTPREDVIPEMTTLVGRSMEVVEFGALDGVPVEELRLAAPEPSDPALLTRLRNGEDIELSLDWTSDRMSGIYSKIAAGNIDLVVLMSTLLGATPAPARATIFCDRVVARAIETFTGSGLRVGVVMPLDGQSDMVGIESCERGMIRAGVARPGDGLAIAAATDGLRDRDVLILHSISYSEAERRDIARHSGKPVVHARQLVASAIREALDRLAAPRGPNAAVPLRERLRTLSPREREIMYLVAEGLTNKEIAFRLGNSFRTVEIHRARMMSKMDFRTMTDLIRTVDSLSEF